MLSGSPPSRESLSSSPSVPSLLALTFSLEIQKKKEEEEEVVEEEKERKNNARLKHLDIKKNEEECKEKI